MTKARDATLTLLADAGLVSWLRLDGALQIRERVGRAHGEAVIGQRLGEAVPALYGMEEQILRLRACPDDQFVMTNVAEIDAAGTRPRQDYVVVRDRADDGFVVCITPSLGNDACSIEREQNLRRHYQLEKQVARQAEEIARANRALQRVNEDLVNFTRMISHDLKAPMRALRYTADEIEAMLDAPDRAQRSETIADLRQHAGRLSRMVTDLLAYARLGDKADAVTTIDSRAVIGDIVASMQPPAGVRIEIRGCWPAIETALAPFDIVLRNLVDNAIKHHDRDDGEILVEAEATDNALAVRIIDDGPGIPADFRSAVVRPFFKVNQDGDQASGLGLAMVRRTAELHGATMEIGDRNDGKRGASIRITWPMKFEFHGD